MNDGIEQLLQIDALGQAVGSNQQPLLGFGHTVHPRAPLFGCQRAGHRLYAQFRKGFVKTRRDVIGGRDETAEDDGVGALGDERFQDFDSRFELRIRRTGQPLGPRDEPRERSRFFQARRRLHIERVRFVGIVIKYLLFEPLRICSKTVTKRAERGGRRRADAAHQRQGAPKGKPSPPLIRPGALNDAEAVVEHRIVERPVLRA